MLPAKRLESFYTAASCEVVKQSYQISSVSPLSAESSRLYLLLPTSASKSFRGESSSKSTYATPPKSIGLLGLLGASLSIDPESEEEDESHEKMEPELVCELADLIKMILYDTSDILNRIDTFKVVEPMLEEFTPLMDVLNPEILLMRAWSNELRLMDYTAISGQDFCMSMANTMMCDAVLTGAWEYLRKAVQIMSGIEKDFKEARKEQPDDSESRTLARVSQVAALYTSLSSVMTQLREFNGFTSEGRSEPLSIDGLTFTMHEEPLKMMWNVAIEGLELLEAEFDIEEWTELLRRVNNWGCGLFDGLFPLDLHFDWKEPRDNSRSLLLTGLYGIIQCIDVCLREIPSTSDSVAEVQSLQTAISTLMMKEEFLGQALGRWHRDMLTISEQDQGLEVVENMKSNLYLMQSGMSLIESVQNSIHRDHRRVWHQNPELIEAVRESIQRNISPRLQSLRENGLIPPRAPPLYRAKHIWVAADDRNEDHPNIIFPGDVRASAKLVLARLARGAQPNLVNYVGIQHRAKELMGNFDDGSHAVSESWTDRIREAIQTGIKDVENMMQKGIDDALPMPGTQASHVIEWLNLVT